jgi:TP901 family phage tail tape measure protein
MDVSLLIRLIDQVSGPAQKVRSAVKGIGAAAGELKRGFGQAIREGFSVENYETASKNAEAALTRARNRLIGAAGMAVTLAAPVVKAADFQSAFIDFANVAEIPIDRMGEIEARLIAATRTTGKNKAELLEILSTYVGKGMGLEQSLAAIEATGRASTATKAAQDDMANAGFAVMDNLKVGAEDLAKAFDIMAASGKEGSFELKDMARNFPQLTASASSLGMKGTASVASLSAALQIAMKSTGSADQAANNMANFLGKITAPDAVKNFKDFGIDIEKELKRAHENGADPLLHTLELIEKATSGGDQFKMGELFVDKQVKDFLLALIPNLKEYERIRDKVADAEGVVDKDWINVMSGLKQQFKGLTTEIDNLFSSGGALLPIVQEIVTWMTGAVRTVNDWTQANPELTAAIVKGVAAFLTLAIAGRVLAFAIAGLRVGILPLLGFLLKFNAQGRNIALGWRLLAGSARFLGAALRVAGAGLSGFVSGAASATRSLIAARNRVSLLRTAIAGAWMLSIGFEILDDLGRTPEERLEQMRRNHQAWQRFERDVEESSFGRAWQSIKDKANELMGLEKGIVPAEALAAWGSAKAAEFQAIAGQWIDALLAGLSGAWGRLSAWLDTQITALGNLLTFDVTINWPEPPAWVSRLLGLGSNAVSAVSDWASSIGGGESAPASGSQAPEQETDWLAPLRNLFSGSGDTVTQKVEQTIAAEVLDKRPPQVTQHISAPISITGVVDPVAAANAAAARLGSAIANAKTGAMHGGTEE